NYADALAGVPFAHQLNAPILLTLPNDLYKETLAEMARLGAKKVVILGGESAISAKVAGQLKAAGLTVERISGSDRFETAAKIASEMESSDKVVIANGMDFPDALSVAAHAAKSGMPILLT
ncbi:cell wall-binding repeat-containing protein, partial [Microvirga sp. 3-52]|nr:cell wall-binding repeat-containing protein [Microvirga sp. 3-52]